MGNSSVFGSGDCPNTPPVLVGPEIGAELHGLCTKNRSRHLVILPGRIEPSIPIRGAMAITRSDALHGFTSPDLQDLLRLGLSHVPSAMANDGDCGFWYINRAAPRELRGRPKTEGVLGQSPLPKKTSPK
jgi:hypothetical protein